MNFGSTDYTELEFWRHVMGAANISLLLYSSISRPHAVAKYSSTEVRWLYIYIHSVCTLYSRLSTVHMYSGTHVWNHRHVRVNLPVSTSFIHPNHQHVQYAIQSPHHSYIQTINMYVIQSQNHSYIQTINMYTNQSCHHLLKLKNQLVQTKSKTWVLNCYWKNSLQLYST